FFVAQHGSTFACNPLSLKLQADALPQALVLAPALQRSPANEVALVHLDGPPKSGLKRIDLFAQFVAIEWHGGFQTARVPRAEAARLCTPRQQVFPKRYGQRGADHDFKTILAGVAGPADDAVAVAVAGRGRVIISQLARVRFREPAAHLDRFRPLHGDHASGRGLIHDLHVPRTFVLR